MNAISTFIYRKMDSLSKRRYFRMTQKEGLGRAFVRIGRNNSETQGHLAPWGCALHTLAYRSRFDDPITAYSHPSKAFLRSRYYNQYEAAGKLPMFYEFTS